MGRFPDLHDGTTKKAPKRVLGDPNEFALNWYYTKSDRKIRMTDEMINKELKRRYKIKEQELRDERQDTLDRLELANSKSKGDRFTIAQAVDKFFQSRLLELEESTRPAYIRHLNMVKDHYGELTLNQMDRDKIIEFRDSLTGVRIDRHGNGKGKIRSKQTINRHIASVSSLFKAATQDWGWFDKMNPCDQIRTLSEANTGVERDPLTGQEIMRLMNSCVAENEMLLTSVVLALSTGARQGEVWTLRWGQIDFDQGLVKFLKTKNKKKRSVGLYAGSYELLENLRGDKERDPSELVFPSRYDSNKPYDFRFPFKKVKKVARIKNFRWHDFRHTTASFLMMTGVDRKTIKDIMGWKSDSMLERYIHLTASHTSEGHKKMIDKFLKDIPTFLKAA